MTVTSFILWRCSDTLERSKEPSVSNQVSCTVLVGHKGRRQCVCWGGGDGSLPGPLAYLPLAPEAFALAGWVTSKAKEATVQCQASKGFQLNC